MFFLKRVLLPLGASLLIVSHSFAGKPAPPPANARTINNLSGFPLAHLKKALSPKLYKSLLISPVTAWVVAQAPASSGAEPKILQSDAGGQFDGLAKEMAKDWTPVGFNTTESRLHRPPVLRVHLLIYKLPDALLAVNFSHNDESYHQGLQYSDVWVGTYKNGKWTRVGGTKFTRKTPEPTG